MHLNKNMDAFKYLKRDCSHWFLTLQVQNVTEVGAKVILKGFVTPTNVAQCIVESLNPAKLLSNGELLGREWCEVNVTVTTGYEESLILKLGGVKVGGQVIGRNVHWPKHLVQDAR